ncbi:MAG TPA: apolipoprotein N-acyltransferase, partial [Pseudolysinimonas sp.]|nr:apolipoprotein N-acyltransferase [Pseudolysinimonas sp.]
MLPPPRPVLPLWAAILVAIAGGPILDGAFPDTGIWPLVFLGIACQLVALQGRRLGSAFLIGLLFGTSFYGVQIIWATTFLGPVPWAALTVFMGLWCGLGGMLVTLAYRWVPTAFPTAISRLLFLPAVVAGLWTLREAIASVWPWGGFSWGRVAFSQSDSAVSNLFPWIGTSGVSFCLVAFTAIAIAAVQEGWRAARSRSATWNRPWVDGDAMKAVGVTSGVAAVPWATRGALVVAVATLLVVIPAFPVSTTGTLRVGAVQGDTKAGYFDPPAHFGDNLLGQIAATQPVYGRDVDVVIWPEGASDVDPLEDSGAAELWTRVAERAGAPLVAGTITARTTTEAGKPVTRYYNTSILWKAGTGQVDFYDKKHPVPFGEYVPARPFFHALAPALVDLIQREYTPGTTDDVLDIGKAVAGIAICFDIVDDQIMRDGVDEGDQIVFAQTNNADFGHTDESVQQLAIARIRARELGRSVVNVS